MFDQWLFICMLLLYQVHEGDKLSILFEQVGNSLGLIDGSRAQKNLTKQCKLNQHKKSSRLISP